MRRRIGPLPPLNYFRIFTLLAALGAAALAISLVALATQNEKQAHAAPTKNSATSVNPPEIVNGVPAAPGEYPAQGYLQFQAPSLPPDKVVACGGTLVAAQKFLTAAHCVTDENTGSIGSPQEFLIALGEVNLNNISSNDLYEVSSVERDQSYNPDTHDDDVAMLTLSRPAPFQPTRVVTTSERNLWAPGVIARIIGWGTTSSGGPSSDILLKANAPIDSDQVCANAYPAVFDPQAMVCAGNGSTDTCQGDSGGPLLVPDLTTGQGFALAGVVSFGNGCADPNFPGVYARVGDEPLNSWVLSRISSGTPPPHHHHKKHHKKHHH